jgi:hypothetical protein
MKKSLAFAFTILSALIILSSLLSFSHATDYSLVGPKVGETADYTFASNDQGLNGAVAHEFFQNIEGTIVTINGTIRYANGTVQAESMSGDISTGQNSFYYFLICANLTAGDPIYNGSSMRISDTSSMSVLNATREVNHMSEQYIVASLDIRWDKLTGLMISLVGSGFGKSISVSLTNTTVWSTSYPRTSGTNSQGGTSSGTSLNIWLIAVPVTGTVLVVAVLLLRRSDRQSGRESK